MSHGNAPGTQEDRIADVLRQALQGALRHHFVANDGWVNKQYFVRVLGLTQAGRAIWNLEHKMGYVIEHSNFKDDYGFRSYRLKSEPQQIFIEA